MTKTHYNRSCQQIGVTTVDFPFIKLVKDLANEIIIANLLIRGKQH